MRFFLVGLLVLIASFTIAGCGGGGGGGGQGSSNSSNLVAYWPANGNYNDVVGGNNGTPYGGVTFAPGKYDEAFSFDGSSGRIFIADSPSLALTQSMAITAWIDPVSYPSDHAYIFFRGDDRVGYDPYSLYITSSGNLGFDISDQFNDNAGVESSTTVPLNTWTFVACSLDNTTGAMTVYINGVPTGTTITTLRPYATLDPTANPGIGIANTQSANYSFYFDGLIEQVKVYNAWQPGAQVPSE